MYKPLEPQFCPLSLDVTSCEACRERAAADALDIRRSLAEIAAEVKVMRDSVTRLEEAHHERQVEDPKREAPLPPMGLVHCIDID